jgi:superfamily II DNA/RNA helicase
VASTQSLRGPMYAYRRGSRIFVGAPRYAVSFLPPPLFASLPASPPPSGGRAFHSAPPLAAPAPPLNARARLDLLSSVAEGEGEDDETKRPARLPGAPADSRGARADGRGTALFTGERRGGAGADGGAQPMGAERGGGAGGEGAAALAAARGDVESTPLAQFADLLSAPLRARLARVGVAGLFPVQAATVRAVCGGQDVVVRSRTGSGKTLGFAIPAVALLEAHAASLGGARPRTPRVLVLAPTRELAKQICDEFLRVGGVRVVVLYGGAARGGQAAELRGGVDVVVGTPGRVADFIEGGELELGAVRVAVLDEADHMLDLGFKEDVEKILGFTPRDKQTMLWSATMPRWVHSLTQQFLRSPAYIDLVGDEAAKLPPGVAPVAYVVPENEREAALKSLLEALVAGAAPGAPPPRVLVFADTKVEVEHYSHINLQSTGLRMAALHGDVSQAGRERVLADFRAGVVHVVVATDVAARGLDVNDVSHVVQVSVPASVETFTHRAGRTGRAGRKGEAIVFVEPRGFSLLQDMARALGFAWSVRGVPAPLPHGLVRRGDGLALENAASTRLAACVTRNVSACKGSPVEALAAGLLEAHGALPALSAALGALLAAGGGAKTIDAVVAGTGGRSLITGAPGRATLRLNCGSPAWAAAVGCPPLPPPPAPRDVAALLPPPRVTVYAAAAAESAAALLTRVGVFPEAKVRRVEGWLAEGGAFVCDAPLGAMPALKALVEQGLVTPLQELPREVVEAIAQAPGQLSTSDRRARSRGRGGGGGGGGGWERARVRTAGAEGGGARRAPSYERYGGRDHTARAPSGASAHSAAAYLEDRRRKY